MLRNLTLFLLISLLAFNSPAEEPGYEDQHSDVGAHDPGGRRRPHDDGGLHRGALRRCYDRHGSRRPPLQLRLPSPAVKRGEVLGVLSSRL